MTNLGNIIFNKTYKLKNLDSNDNVLNEKNFTSPAQYAKKFLKKIAKAMNRTLTG